VPFIVCLILYLLCWYTTARFIIRRRWLGAGTPGNWLVYSLATFFIAQFLVLYGVACGIMLLVSRDGGANQNTVIIAEILATLLLVFVIVFVRSRIKAKNLSVQTTTTDLRKGLMLATWISASLLFLLTAAILYGFLYWCETI
jgi:hypothetical protein